MSNQSITDNMYGAAFQYKKTKLWKQMYDSELFAVRLSDGEIAYCCVMGLAGEHISLAAYIGDEGFQSFRELAFREEEPFDFFDMGSMLDMEWMFHQSCLQCSFESKDDLSYEDYMTARDYAQSHRIRQRGAHAWPNFTKSMRYRMPWRIDTDTDRRRITEALLAGVALSEILQTKSKSEIGLYPIEEDTETLLLLVPGKKGYTVDSIHVPPEWVETFREPAPPNKEQISKLMKLKKRGVYDCELIRLPGLIEGQSDAGEAPYFPALLLCVDTKTRHLMATKAVTDYDTNPKSLRDEFAETLLESGVCPRAVRVRNEQTKVLLVNLCTSAHILFSVEENLPALDEAREHVLSMLHNDEDDDEDDLWDDDDDDDIDFETAISAAVEELSNMSDRELKQLPPAMVMQILEMGNFGFVPQELQLRLRRLFKKF